MNESVYYYYILFCNDYMIKRSPFFDFTPYQASLVDTTTSKSSIINLNIFPSPKNDIICIQKQIDTSSQCRNFGMLNWNKSHKKGIKYIKKIVTYLTCSVSIFIQINLYTVVRVCNGPSLCSPILLGSGFVMVRVCYVPRSIVTTRPFSLPCK